VKSNFSKELPVRPPILCPGCHHRGVFYVLKKLGIHASGDIGCYTLAAFPPLNAMDTAICMGASIGMAFGFEKARGKDFAKKTVAVLGDSTFIHSGITGLIDVVYNKGNTTVIILDNSITGMTGHQENPATGYNLQGEPTYALDFEALGKALGIKRVQTVDAYDIIKLEEVIKEETQAEEPSLIITKRPCVLLKRANIVKKQLKVDKDLCIGCKTCFKIGCPSIVFRNNKAEINNILCVGCELCTKVCKFNAIGAIDGGEVR